MTVHHQRCPHCLTRAGLRQRTSLTTRGLRHHWLCGECEASFVSYDEPAGEKARVEQRTVDRMLHDLVKQAEAIRGVLGADGAVGRKRRAAA